jgi:hypothetical protein
MTGVYRFYLRIVDHTNNDTLRYPAAGTLHFFCKPSALRGFLKVDTADRAYLQYDDGGLYVGIGNNLCGWEWGGTSNSRGTYDYDDWLTNMFNNKANLAQFDFCEGDQLEWTDHPGELPYAAAWHGINYYNQQNAWKMDYRMNKATQLGIYYRISLSHWEDFDSETAGFPDWGWSRNPYNIRNGGPVADVTGFFTNKDAKAYYKQYLRYVVARWGYSRNMLAYELWNEVDAPEIVWGPGRTYASEENDIRDWHREMAAFLKQLDPGHLVTTSFANSPNQPSVWALKDIDITTIHRYTMYNASYGDEQYETEYCIGRIIRERFAQFPKPVLIGEFALSPGGEVQKQFDSTGIAFHNQLWASVMQRSMATAMHWNWGSYIEHNHLYYHYRPLGIFLSGEDLSGMQVCRTDNPVARSYGLKTSSKAYIWVQDCKHTFIGRAYPREVIHGQQIRLTGMKKGSYSITFLNTYTGNSHSATGLVGPDGELMVPVPDFTGDIAIKLKLIKSH